MVNLFIKLVPLAVSGGERDNPYEHQCIANTPHRHLIAVTYMSLPADALLNLYRQGKIKPVISETFAWVDAALAIARLEQRASKGRQVVLIAP